MPQAQGKSRRAVSSRPTPPGTTFVERIAGTVHTQDRAKNTVLDPVCKQLIIFNTPHVPTDIMTPPAVTYISYRRSETGLIGKRLPANDCIARKTDWVTVIAQATPTRKYKRTFPSITAQVKKVQVINPP